MGIFGQGKKSVKISEVIGATKKGTIIPETGGMIYPRQDLIRELKTLLPYQKFSTQLSLEEAKLILRKLRHEEYAANNADKKISVGRLKRLLEESWGLKGQY